MAIEKNGTHSVGNLNSYNVRTIPEVVAGADIDNYTLVELAYADGVRTATQLDPNTATGYLICSDEVRYDGEQYKEFYNGTGEFVRVIHLDKGVRFDTSAYAQIEATAPAVGQFASWDATAKKFQLEATESATAKNTFMVVDINAAEYGLGVSNVRLEILK
jgi:hypothetical protein